MSLIIPKTLDLNVAEFAEIAFPGGGWFVEAGGHDGITQSNTLALDKEKWRGLMIEPSPVSFGELRKNRPEVIAANVALVDSPDVKFLDGTFHSGSPLATAHPALKSRDSAAYGRSGYLSRSWRTMIRALGWKSRTPTTRVKATTLTDLIEEVGISQIDLFVLDVEGLEISVLEGFSFAQKPRAIVIETRSSDAMEINEFLLNKGYFLVANLSNFSRQTHPGWSGDHQDFLWISNSETQILSRVREMSFWS